MAGAIKLFTRSGQSGVWPSAPQKHSPWWYQFANIDLLKCWSLRWGHRHSGWWCRAPACSRQCGSWRRCARRRSTRQGRSWPCIGQGARKHRWHRWRIGRGSLPPHSTIGQMSKEKESRVAKILLHETFAGERFYFGNREQHETHFKHLVTNLEML